MTDDELDELIRLERGKTRSIIRAIVRDAQNVGAIASQVERFCRTKRSRKGKEGICFECLLELVYVMEEETGPEPAPGDGSVGEE